MQDSSLEAIFQLTTPGLFTCRASINNKNFESFETILEFKGRKKDEVQDMKTDSESLLRSNLNKSNEESFQNSQL